MYVYLEFKSKNRATRYIVRIHRGSNLSGPHDIGNSIVSRKLHNVATLTLESPLFRDRSVSSHNTLYIDLCDFIKVISLDEVIDKYHELLVDS